jgi:hypothetical protein
LDRLDFDQSNQVLKIPIRLNRKGLEGELTVRNVHRFKIRDEAAIGEGDINTIEYGDGVVVIRGAIPVDLKIEVAALDLILILPPNAPLA